jgi:hypothetical protein
MVLFLPGAVRVQRAQFMACETTVYVGDISLQSHYKLSNIAALENYISPAIHGYYPVKSLASYSERNEAGF